MNARTRGSCGSQSCVPSSEQESCTMCSNSTPRWSATDAMHSLSQLELRKLGVMMENFSRCPPGAEDAFGMSAVFISSELEAFFMETGFEFSGSAIGLLVQ